MPENTLGIPVVPANLVAVSVGLQTEEPYSLISVITGLRLDFRGIVLRFLAGTRDVSLLQSAHISSETHPVGAWVSFLGIRRLGCKCDYSPPCRAEVSNERRFTFSVQYTS